MPTILLTNCYRERPLEIISNIVPAGFKLEMLSEVSQEELIKKANLAEYFLVSGRLQINEEVLERANRLKMIQRTGVGVEGIDLEAMKHRNIPLYVNRGINSRSVAEHTLLLILSSLRNLPVINDNTKRGSWKKQEQGVITHELAGLTIGIIGMGDIGKYVSKMLKGFDVNVLYCEQKPLEREEESKLQVTQVEVDVLLAKSDIITLHCPLSDETEGIINKYSIAKMKQGVKIINTARGKLINENDVIEALKEGKISGMGLDVYANEPPENNELLSFENVITTPHIGGVTFESFQNMMGGALRNISKFEKGNFEEIEKYKYKEWAEYE